ncbi:MAG: hypothetical protein Kow0059_22180 [Candidatus Sumerlaeia bacterium]
MNVTDSWVTVNLANWYASPVIVCTVNYRNNTIPVVTRIDAVTNTSFDLRLQNPGDLGTPAPDEVHYIVMEEGVWTMPDGRKVEARKYLSTVTSENNSWVGETRTYGQTYTSPVVLGQVMSYNDSRWSVFWCSSGSRTSPPTASQLRTGKHVAEDTVVTRADETIGYIVIDAGTGTLDGVKYEAKVGSDIVRSVTNAPPYSYTFAQSFSTAPIVAVVSQAAMDGSDGSWAYLYGSSPLTTTQIRLALDEDQIGGSERSHSTEQVAWIAFESHVVYP